MGGCCHALRPLSRSAARLASEHESFGYGVAGKPIGAISSSDHFARHEEARHFCFHMGIGGNAAHGIVRERRYLDRHFRQVDAVFRKSVDHWSERLAQGGLRTVLEAKIRAAMWRAAAGLNFF